MESNTSHSGGEPSQFPAALVSIDDKANPRVMVLNKSVVSYWAKGFFV